jgi:hypothetical protein
LSDLAKQVAADYQEEWDIDCWDDDSATPSLKAYKMVLTSVHRERSAVVPAVATAGESEGGDDESVGELGNYRGEENQTNWNLKTIVQDIRDGVLTASSEWQRSLAWTPLKQRRLIESLLLRRHIHSFLFFEDTQTGKKYIIDGSATRRA